MLGSPGAGKGTQAAILSDYYHIPHISTGDIFRQNLADNTALGQRARDFMNQGVLVPDDVTEAMVADRLSQPDTANGFILDGFPRNIAQGHALAAMLAERHVPLHGVIYIAVAHDLLVKRLVGRRVCAECGAGYHVEFDPPKVVDVCDRCGGKLIQRADDLPETVETRLKVYQEQTAPLIGFYREQGVLVEVDGAQSVDAVTRSIVHKLEALHD
ncbi:MAG: adenylate kinase [Sulfobacillus thermosulfidooxidans]|uniref:Adenylate kinase n=2 Tax=Clostridiales Family XVII. Incertae Sedis TaxID=539000 RepID=A0ABN5H4G3_9FIRM|nr:adenylate kinase [Sulfobacillus thermotolerans]POB11269.1 adenylate kinase [Sulfobacillus sp. hq2]PSR37240.1 MAG: adenylate kinase [Sulfobacillus thermosulfidooxidans]